MKIFQVIVSFLALCFSSFAMASPQHVEGFGLDIYVNNSCSQVAYISVVVNGVPISNFSVQPQQVYDFSYVPQSDDPFALKASFSQTGSPVVAQQAFSFSDDGSSFIIPCAPAVK